MFDRRTWALHDAVMRVAREAGLESLSVECKLRTMRLVASGARVSRPGWVLVAAAAWGLAVRETSRKRLQRARVPHADSAAQSLVAANTGFGVDFYRAAVGAVGAGQNAVLSPYSASARLTMVDVGAAGETATQLRTTLHLPDSGTDIAPAFARLLARTPPMGRRRGISS